MHWRHILYFIELKLKRIVKNFIISNWLLHIQWCNSLWSLSNLLTFAFTLQSLLFIHSNKILTIFLLIFQFFLWILRWNTSISSFSFLLLLNYIYFKIIRTFWYDVGVVTVDIVSAIFLKNKIYKSKREKKMKNENLKKFKNVIGYIGENVV